MNHAHILYMNIPGIMVGHVSPEAHVGGPIAVVRNGDMITIDVQQKILNLVLESLSQNIFCKVSKM